MKFVIAYKLLLSMHAVSLRHKKHICYYYSLLQIELYT